MIKNLLTRTASQSFRKSRRGDCDRHTPIVCLCTDSWKRHGDARGCDVWKVKVETVHPVSFWRGVPHLSKLAEDLQKSTEKSLQQDESSCIFRKGVPHFKRRTTSFDACRRSAGKLWGKSLLHKKIPCLLCHPQLHTREDKHPNAQANTKACMSTRTHMHTQIFIRHVAPSKYSQSIWRPSFARYSQSK